MVLLVRVPVWRGMRGALRGARGFLVFTGPYSKTGSRACVKRRRVVRVSKDTGRGSRKLRTRYRGGRGGLRTRSGKRVRGSSPFSTLPARDLLLVRCLGRAL